MCYWLKTTLEELGEGVVKIILGKTMAQAMSWRCKSAGAWAWQDWAKQKGLSVFPDNVNPLPGDVCPYDFSHIGLVMEDHGSRIATLEANTGPSGGRDGDGCYAKDRPQEIVRCFIRIFE